MAKRNGRRGQGTRRPWKVFVHDIGPTFAYATEERALAQARRLVSGETFSAGSRGLVGSFGRVSVYEAGSMPFVRRTVRRDGETFEKFGATGWETA